MFILFNSDFQILVIKWLTRQPSFYSCKPFPTYIFLYVLVVAVNKKFVHYRTYLKQLCKNGNVMYPILNAFHLR